MKTAQKQALIFSSLLLVFALLVFIIPSVHAQTQVPDPLGLNISDPEQAVQTIIGNIIKAALGIVGTVTLIVTVYGGFLWLTSAGNETRITKGKETLIWAVLGLAFVFGSYALVNQIFKAIPPPQENANEQTANDSACVDAGGVCSIIPECQGFTDQTAGISLDECLEQNKPAGTNIQRLCSGEDNRVCVFSTVTTDEECVTKANYEVCQAGSGYCFDRACYTDAVGSCVKATGGIQQNGAKCAKQGTFGYCDSGVCVVPCSGKNPGDICSTSEGLYGICGQSGECTRFSNDTVCKEILGPSAACLNSIPPGRTASDCNTDPKICGTTQICCR